MTAETCERETQSGAIINDTRTDEQKAATICYVVATDSFMSGWGKATGRSYYAIACGSSESYDDVANRMSHRDEMKRQRYCGKDWRPHLRQGDHLSIRWETDFTYQPKMN